MSEVTLMDDEFFDLCMNDSIPCVQKIIHIILGRDDLTITSVETQKDFKGFKRSLRLDVYAVDDVGRIYNIEIQVRNEGARPKRARFHSSMLDVQNLEKGSSFEDLPESYVIFITMNDVLGYGRTVYTIHRYIDGLNELFKDDQHIIFVNCAAADDGTEISRLIHDMKCVNPDEMLIPELAERAGHFKVAAQQERSGSMRELVEEMFDDLIEARAEKRVKIAARKAAREAAKEAEEKAAEAQQKVAEAEQKADEAEEKAAEAQQKAAKAQQKADEAEKKADEAQQKAAKAEQKAAKVEKKAKRDKESFVVNIIKTGAMALDAIAEAFNVPLEEVQTLAKRAGA